MQIYDYIILFFSFLLFPFVNSSILCFWGDLDKLHAETDLFRSRLEGHLQKLDRLFGSRWIVPLFLTALSFLFWKFIDWDVLDSTHLLHYFIGVVCAIICWKGITLDTDIVTGQPTFTNRLLFGLSFIGTLFYPGFIFLFLFIGIQLMRSWYHHQLMSLRLLQMFSSFLVATGLVNLAQLAFKRVEHPHLAVPLFLFLWVLAAHYCYSGFSKLVLGEKWYSWILDNKIHYLAISAYMWGWAKFQNAQQRLNWINKIAPFDRLFQIGAILFECGWIFAGFSVHIAEALCLGAILFHFFVFLLTGILFWQSILVQFAFFCVLVSLPPEAVHTLFTPTNGILLGLLLLILVPLKKLWTPLKLSWWDSPFEGRIHWYVVGKSGKRYGLYNDFMDPHERFFGRHMPFFLIPFKAIHTYLGEVDSVELRDQIIATKGDLNELDRLRELSGFVVHHPQLAQIHDEYIKEFFAKLNTGIKKQACPSWLKAPGGQIYYWGKLPPFKGQEPVDQVLVFFTEEFYNGKEIVTVQDQLLRVIKID